MNPTIAGGDVATAVVDRANERALTEIRLDPGADGVRIGSTATKLKDQRPSLFGSLVPEDNTWGIQVDDDEVEVAVAVEVSRGQPSAQVSRLKIGPRTGRHVAKPTVSLTMPENRRVLVRVGLRGLGADVAVGDHQVEQPVLIEVGQC